MVVVMPDVVMVVVMSHTDPDAMMVMVMMTDPDRDLGYLGVLFGQSGIVGLQLR
jgi:hypothetical protein